MGRAPILETSLSGVHSGVRCLPITHLHSRLSLSSFLLRWRITSFMWMNLPTPGRSASSTAGSAIASTRSACSKGALPELSVAMVEVLIAHVELMRSSGCPARCAQVLTPSPWTSCATSIAGPSMPCTSFAFASSLAVIESVSRSAQSGPCSAGSTARRSRGALAPGSRRDGFFGAGSCRPGRAVLPQESTGSSCGRAILYPRARPCPFGRHRRSSPHGCYVPDNRPPLTNRVIHSGGGYQFQDSLRKSSVNGNSRLPAHVDRRRRHVHAARACGPCGRSAPGAGFRLRRS